MPNNSANIWKLVVLFSTGALSLGCGVVRPSDHGPSCPDYEQVVKPVLEANCASCHSAGNAAGDYAIGDYLNTVSRSEDGSPRVEPGTEESPLLAAARGERAGHSAVSSADLELLNTWAVACRAAPRGYANHLKGWGTPTDDEQFHGKVMRDAGYAFSSCVSCHGADLRGGKSGVDCNSCHTEADGPKACSTCHGDSTSAAPPKALDGSRWTKSRGVGAHRRHVLATEKHPAYDCKTCHPEVKKFIDHVGYVRGGSFNFQPATVVFSGALADAGASWDAASGTCSAACHAPNAADTAAQKHQPQWTQVSDGEVPCDSCHGQPPSTHFDNRCSTCHGPGYADGGVETVLHLNGTVDVQGSDGNCESCHAGTSSPAFFDLSKRSAPSSAASVGLHDAHLKASSFRGPLACGDCHQVPSQLKSTGHIDSASPAEVFPASIGASSIAFADGAQPSYNPANNSCGNVYCHGASMPADAGVDRTPSWVAGTVACGTACHALPPNDGTPSHTAPVAACSTCHGGSVLPDGGILFISLPDGGVRSNHLDGRVTGGP